jgi:hypothetical protein
VVSCARNAERAANLAPAAQIIQADIANEDDRRRLLGAAPQLYGRVVFTGDPARATGPVHMPAMLADSLRAHPGEGVPRLAAGMAEASIAAGKYALRRRGRHLALRPRRR